MPLSPRISPPDTLTPHQRRIARGDHDLCATGPCALLLALLPGLVARDGGGNVIVSYRLGAWLGLPVLVIDAAVASVRIFHYVVAPSRIGAALDVLLPLLPGVDFDAPSPMPASVLRRLLVQLAAAQRPLQLSVFTVTMADLYEVVGTEHVAEDTDSETSSSSSSDSDDSNAAPAAAVGMTGPGWLRRVTIGMLVCSGGTLIILADFEMVLYPHFHYARLQFSGFLRLGRLLMGRRAGGLLPADEAACLTGLLRDEVATEISTWLRDVLPLPLEFTEYPTTRAAACLLLTRAASRGAARGASEAAAVGVHEARVVVQHYRPLLLVVGVECGGTATLGMLVELARLVLRSSLSTITLGTCASVADGLQHLVPTLEQPSVRAMPPAERLALVAREQREYEAHEKMGRAAGGSIDSGVGGSSGRAAAATGVAPIYVSALREVVHTAAFSTACATITLFSTASFKY